MLGGLTLTIGSTLFIILLLIVYLIQQKRTNMKNRIYVWLLLMALLIAILEIVDMFLITNDTSIIHLINIKAQWFSGLIWFTLLFYYIITFICEMDVHKMKEVIRYNDFTKASNIIFLLAYIVYFILPVTIYTKDNITYIPGAASYFVFAFAFFILILTSIYYFTGKSINRKDKRKISFFALLFVGYFAIIILEIKYPYIAFCPIGLAIVSYFLYFIVENPSLRMINELETLNNDISKSLTAKSYFLSNMSNDITDPIDIISNTSKELYTKDNIEKDYANKCLETILYSGNNLLYTMNNLLDILMIENDKDSLDNREYSMTNILCEIYTIIQNKIDSSANIELIFDVDKNLPSRLEGDSNKIFQIILNALYNSIKDTQIGKIKVKIKYEFDSEDIGLITIRVSDTGKGLKEEEFKKKTEGFYKINAYSNETYGLEPGLIIIKKYIDLLGGSVEYKSEYEVGNTLTFKLTQRIINATPDDAVNYKVQMFDKIHYKDLSGKRVLIVDDNYVNSKVTERLLKPYNFNVDIMHSGKDCIYNIKLGEKYDLIFLDPMMPEMSGIEVVKILKKLPEYDIPPIIALTANALLGSSKIYLEAGYDDYLSKPINILDLNDVINKYFDKK